MADINLKNMTADELAELPSGMGERFELIEGELIVMAPAGGEHGTIALNIGSLVRVWLIQNPIGRAYGAETGYYTRGDNRTVRAPDVSFVSYAKIPKGENPKGYIRVAPELVVEVVSPNDRADEVEQKTQEWLDFGVLMVLNAYPTTKRLHVFRPEKSLQILEATDTFDGDDVLPGFSVPVSAFFED